MKTKKLWSVLLALSMIMSVIVTPELASAKWTETDKEIIAWSDGYIYEVFKNSMYEKYSENRNDLSFNILGITDSNSLTSSSTFKQYHDATDWAANKYIWVGVYMNRLGKLTDIRGIKAVNTSMLFNTDYLTNATTTNTMTSLSNYNAEGFSGKSWIYAKAEENVLDDDNSDLSSVNNQEIDYDLEPQAVTMLGAKTTIETTEEDSANIDEDEKYDRYVGTHNTFSFSNVKEIHVVANQQNSSESKPIYDNATVTAEGYKDNDKLITLYCFQMNALSDGLAAPDKLNSIVQGWLWNYNGIDYGTDGSLSYGHVTKVDDTGKSIAYYVNAINQDLSEDIGKYTLKFQPKRTAATELADLGQDSNGNSKVLSAASAAFPTTDGASAVYRVQQVDRPTADRNVEIEVSNRTGSTLSDTQSTAIAGYDDVITGASTGNVVFDGWYYDKVGGTDDKPTYTATKLLGTDGKLVDETAIKQDYTLYPVWVESTQQQTTSYTITYEIPDAYYGTGTDTAKSAYFGTTESPSKTTTESVDEGSAISGTPDVKYTDSSIYGSYELYSDAQLQTKLETMPTATEDTTYYVKPIVGKKSVTMTLANISDTKIASFPAAEGSGTALSQSKDLELGSTVPYDTATLGTAQYALTITDTDHYAFDGIYDDYKAGEEGAADTWGNKLAAAADSTKTPKEVLETVTKSGKSGYFIKLKKIASDITYVIPETDVSGNIAHFGSDTDKKPSGKVEKVTVGGDIPSTASAIGLTIDNSSYSIEGLYTNADFAEANKVDLTNAKVGETDATYYVKLVNNNAEVTYKIPSNVLDKAYFSTAGTAEKKANLAKTADLPLTYTAIASNFELKFADATDDTETNYTVEGVYKSYTAGTDGAEDTWSEQVADGTKVGDGGTYWLKIVPKSDIEYTYHIPDATVKEAAGETPAVTAQSIANFGASTFEKKVENATAGTALVMDYSTLNSTYGFTITGEYEIEGFYKKYESGAFSDKLPDDQKVDANLSDIYIKLTDKHYTVTYNSRNYNFNAASGETAVNAKTESVVSGGNTTQGDALGTDINITDTTYKFDGWYELQDGKTEVSDANLKTEKFTGKNITSDVTVYAKYKQVGSVKYTIVDTTVKGSTVNARTVASFGTDTFEKTLDDLTVGDNIPTDNDTIGVTLSEGYDIEGVYTSSDFSTGTQLPTTTGVVKAGETTEVFIRIKQADATITYSIPAEYQTMGNFGNSTEGTGKKYTATVSTSVGNAVAYDETSLKSAGLAYVQDDDGNDKFILEGVYIDAALNSAVTDSTKVQGTDNETYYVKLKAKDDIKITYNANKYNVKDITPATKEQVETGLSYDGTPKKIDEYKANINITDDGYEFEGWYTLKDGATAGDDGVYPDSAFDTKLTSDTKIKKDTVVYAKYSQYYTVSYHPDTTTFNLADGEAAGLATLRTEKVVKDSSDKFIPKEMDSMENKLAIPTGKYFAGWYTVKSGPAGTTVAEAEWSDTAYTAAEISADLDLYAKFAPIKVQFLGVTKVGEETVNIQYDVPKTGESGTEKKAPYEINASVDGTSVVLNETDATTAAGYLDYDKQTYAFEGWQIASGSQNGQDLTFTSGKFTIADTDLDDHVLKIQPKINKLGEKKITFQTTSDATFEGSTTSGSNKSLEFSISLNLKETDGTPYTTLEEKKIQVAKTTDEATKTDYTKVPVPTWEGHTFKNWVDATTKAVLDENTHYTGDVTYEATWTVDVTFKDTKSTGAATAVVYTGDYNKKLSEANAVVKDTTTSVTTTPDKIEPVLLDTSAYVNSGNLNTFAGWYYVTGDTLKAKSDAEIETALKGKAPNDSSLTGQLTKYEDTVVFEKNTTLYAMYNATDELTFTDTLPATGTDGYTALTTTTYYISDTSKALSEAGAALKKDDSSKGINVTNVPTTQIGEDGTNTILTARPYVYNGKLYNFDDWYVITDSSLSATGLVGVSSDDSSISGKIAKFAAATDTESGVTATNLATYKNVYAMYKTVAEIEFIDTNPDSTKKADSVTYFVNDTTKKLSETGAANVKNKADGTKGAAVTDVPTKVDNAGASAKLFVPQGFVNDNKEQYSFDDWYVITDSSLQASALSGVEATDDSVKDKIAKFDPATQALSDNLKIYAMYKKAPVMNFIEAKSADAKTVSYYVTEATGLVLADAYLKKDDGTKGTDKLIDTPDNVADPDDSTKKLIDTSAYRGGTDSKKGYTFKNWYKINDTSLSVADITEKTEAEIASLASGATPKIELFNTASTPITTGLNIYAVYTKDADVTFEDTKTVSPQSSVVYEFVPSTADETHYLAHANTKAKDRNELNAYAAGTSTNAPEVKTTPPTLTSESYEVTSGDTTTSYKFEGWYYIPAGSTMTEDGIKALKTKAAISGAGSAIAKFNPGTASAAGTPLTDGMKVYALYVEGTRIVFQDTRHSGANPAAITYKNKTDVTQTVYVAEQNSTPTPLSSDDTKAVEEGDTTGTIMKTMPVWFTGADAATNKTYSVTKENDTQNYTFYGWYEIKDTSKITSGKTAAEYIRENFDTKTKIEASDSNLKKFDESTPIENSVMNVYAVYINKAKLTFIDTRLTEETHPQWIYMANTGAALSAAATEAEQTSPTLVGNSSRTDVPSLSSDTYDYTKDGVTTSYEFKGWYYRSSTALSDNSTETDDAFFKSHLTEADYANDLGTGKAFVPFDKDSTEINGNMNIYAVYAQKTRINFQDTKLPENAQENTTYVAKQNNPATALSADTTEATDTSGNIQKDVPKLTTDSFVYTSYTKTAVPPAEDGGETTYTYTEKTQTRKWNKKWYVVDESKIKDTDTIIVKTVTPAAEDGGEPKVEYTERKVANIAEYFAAKVQKEEELTALLASGDDPIIAEFNKDTTEIKGGNMTISPAYLLSSDAYLTNAVFHETTETGTVIPFTGMTDGKHFDYPDPTGTNVIAIAPTTNFVYQMVVTNPIELSFGNLTLSDANADMKVYKAEVAYTYDAPTQEKPLAENQVEVAKTSAEDSAKVLVTVGDEITSAALTDDKTQTALKQGASQPTVVKLPLAVADENSANTIYVKVTADSGDYKEYVFSILRLAVPELKLEYGNTPAGLIWRDDETYPTEADKKAAVTAFSKTSKTRMTYPKDKTTKEYILPIIGYEEKEDENGEITKTAIHPDSSLEYTVAAWTSFSKHNYDLDNDVVVVYQNEKFKDPTYFINDYGEKDANEVTTSFTLDRMNKAGMPVWTSNTNRITSLTNDGTKSDGTYIIKTAYRTYNLYGVMIRPNKYTVKYTIDYVGLTDGVNKTYTGERPLVVIAKWGDVQFTSAGIVDSTDGSKLTEKWPDIKNNKIVNSLYAYRISDVRQLTSVTINNSDYLYLYSHSDDFEDKAKNKDLSVRFYPPIFAVE